LSVRTTPAVLAAVAMVVVGACSSAGGGEIGAGTTTTTDPDRPSTTTTTDDDDPEPDPDPGPGGSGGSGEECLEPPVWAFKAQADDPCEPTPDPGPTPEPELGTGDVQVTLRWESSSDIDLHVFEPDGTEIYFGDRGPTSTGGRLDVDSNVGCEQEASVENVFWPDGDMPIGGYRVVVTGYQVDGCGGGDYTLTANVKGDPVLDETGTVGQDEEDEFTFEAD
jgi:hypothetical protein